MNQKLANGLVAVIKIVQPIFLKSIFILIIILAVPCNAYDSKSDGVKDVFDLGVGAKSLGMGNAWVAIADDASASYWNPAGLAQLKKKQVNSMFTKLDMDRRFDFGSIALPLGHTTIGGFVMRYGLEDILATELNTDQIIGVKPDGTPIYDINILDPYSDNITSLGISLATGLGTNLAIGGTIKYLRDSVYQQKAQGFGADIGFLYHPVKSLKFGLSLRNFPAKMNWDSRLSTSTDLPVSADLGMAYYHSKFLKFAISMKKTEDVDFKFSCGTEYSFKDKVFFRTGYTDSHFTLGLGVTVMNDYTVDYAYADREFEGEHRLSSTYRWGSVKNKNMKIEHPEDKDSLDDKKSQLTYMRKDNSVDSLFIGGEKRRSVKVRVIPRENTEMYPAKLLPEDEAKLAVMSKNPDKTGRLIDKPDHKTFDSFVELVDMDKKADNEKSSMSEQVADTKSQIKNIFNTTSEQVGEFQQSDYFFESKNHLLESFDFNLEKYVPTDDFDVSAGKCPKILFTINRGRRMVYINSRPVKDYRLVESDKNEVMFPLKTIARVFNIFYVYRIETQQVILITPSEKLIKANLYSNMISIDGKYQKMNSPVVVTNHQIMAPLQRVASIIRKSY